MTARLCAGVDGAPRWVPSSLVRRPRVTADQADHFVPVRAPGRGESRTEETGATGEDDLHVAWFRRRVPAGCPGTGRIPSEPEVGLEGAVLEPRLDRGEEARGIGAVDQPVVVGQREVAHRPDRDRLAEVRVVDDHGALDDRAGAEDADLRLVDKI